MATTSVPVLAGVSTFVADVTATTDEADSLSIPHGLGAAPLVLTLTDLLGIVTALSGWVVSASASDILVTKLNIVGSSNAAAQLRVMGQLPHSLIR